MLSLSYLQRIVHSSWVNSELGHPLIKAKACLSDTVCFQNSIMMGWEIVFTPVA